MQDTHHTRRVKLIKDTKTDKYFKLLLTMNDESRRYIMQYQKLYAKAQLRKQEQAAILS